MPNFSKCHSAAIDGVDAIPVEIEVSIFKGSPQISIVGLPDAAVREAKDRVWTALKNSGWQFGDGVVTINLAPADIRKEGPQYDLPIAVGLLAASGKMRPARDVSRFAFAGELSLSGDVRRVRGALALAIAARQAGMQGFVVSPENAGEACLAEGIDVFPVRSLRECAAFLQGALDIPPLRADVAAMLAAGLDSGDDFSDVRGQESAKRAIEVAVAGGHNLLMVGSPGAGKTMLARRIPSILPPLSPEEAVEVTRVHSVAGELPAGSSLVTRRPFRAPHHTVSDAGLLGGGTHPVPGEVSLAHRGVLFLDELPEFRRNVLEVLRQPLEDGHVAIARAAASCDFPSRFMLVAAMNPCPCGYSGDPHRECRCAPGKISAYRGRISGPLLDRIDIQIEVPPVDGAELSSLAPGEPSAAIRARVVAARALQRERYAGIPGVFCNADIPARDLEAVCAMDAEARDLLRLGLSELGLSARAYTRVMKVSRTIADLAGSPCVTAAHVSEAVQYRALDREVWD